MSTQKGFSVKEHLAAMQETRDWVIHLAEAINRLSERDPAIAASRAMDLANNSQLGPATQKIVFGWIELEAAIKNPGVTSWQRTTVSDLMTGILKELQAANKPSL